MRLHSYYSLLYLNLFFLNFNRSYEIRRCLKISTVIERWKFNFSNLTFLSTVSRVWFVRCVRCKIISRQFDLLKSKTTRVVLRFFTGFFFTDFTRWEFRFFESGLEIFQQSYCFWSITKILTYRESRFFK